MREGVCECVSVHNQPWSCPANTTATAPPVADSSDGFGFDTATSRVVSVQTNYRVDTVGCLSSTWSAAALDILTAAGTVDVRAFSFHLFYLPGAAGGGACTYGGLGQVRRAEARCAVVGSAVCAPPPPAPPLLRGPLKVPLPSPAAPASWSSRGAAAGWVRGAVHHMEPRHVRHQARAGAQRGHEPRVHRPQQRRRDRRGVRRQLVPVSAARPLPARCPRVRRVFARKCAPGMYVCPWCAGGVRAARTSCATEDFRGPCAASN
jgi:hypothetical protein